MLSTNRTASIKNALLEKQLRISFSNILLKCLGGLLLMAALMKAHELVTIPVVNQDIWSNRPFLIFQVESEIALGIFLLSGIFKRLAWVAAFACFCLFCCVALFKGLSGVSSCACFGMVHVNPWVTLFAVDLPVVAMLLILRPSHVVGQLKYSWFKGLRVVRLFPRTALSAWQQAERPAYPTLIPNRLWASAISLRSVLTSIVIVLTLGITTPILAFIRPDPVSAQYTVLEPNTWLDKDLPILQFTDIGDQLRQGVWLVLLYRHNCSVCHDVMPEYERVAQELASEQGFLKVAFIEVPPYEQDINIDNRLCLRGRMVDVREWFVTTPVVILLTEGTVRQVWEGKNAPNFEAVLGCL